MTSNESSQIAMELLSERSREALVEGLDVALAKMPPDEMVGFLADLLLAAGADRDHLKQRLATLLAMQFGRRSEQSTTEQLDMFAEALRTAAERTSASTDSATETNPGDGPAETATEIIERTNADVAALAAEQRAQRNAERKARREAAKLALKQGEVEGSVPWPTHLPIREETASVPEADLCCADCGVDRRIIRHETSWRLEYTTTTEVVVTRLPVLACANHHGGPVTMPVPPKPVDKGQMGFSLAAYVLWLRITHNLPVRRIAEMMRAQGVPVSEQMVHTLITVSGKRAEPVVGAIRSAVQQAALVNLDDTPTAVHEGSGTRKRRQARVWLALGDERFAYFFATKSWKAEEAEKALGSISGVLQGDGYAGFPKYTRDNDLDLAGCMAHFRRKLHVAFKARDPRATFPMALVQGLYRVEELARLRGLNFEQRGELRRERSVAIMAELIGWAKKIQPSIVTGSPLGKAWTYLSNQLKPLQVFLYNGTVSIDNNAAERGLRRITIGRKLWLFFRGQAKLEFVANLMSILTTARLHQANELAYLAWLLEQLARREWSVKAAAQLLPDAWIALQKQKELQDIGAG